MPLFNGPKRTVAIAPNTSAKAIPPVTPSDSYTVDENDVLTITAADGVLANDTDTDGDTLTATVVTGPNDGTVSLNSDGSFSYTPDTSFNGTDTFTYVANDGFVDSAETTVTINVDPATIVRVPSATASKV